MVESHAAVSDDELKEVKHVVNAVGDVTYAEAAALHDEADLKAGVDFAHGTRGVYRLPPREHHLAGERTPTLPVD